jgi:hypothetical protein
MTDKPNLPPELVLTGDRAAVAAIDAELRTLAEMMPDPRSKYWRGEDSAKHQARYRELVDAKARYER